ncbi:MAG: M3 family metallopeptidase [Gammaproteobacteria bacterium]|jgi:oligopeptidase A|nr:M3 family metallopeptidase [Gammaproteobacteria bacterium]
MSLMQTLQLPDFAHFDANNIPTQLINLLATSQQQIEQLVAQQGLSYAELIPPLEQIDDAISQVWGPLAHLHSVANTDDVRQAYDSCLPKLTEYSTWLSQNQALYQALESIQQSDEFNQLTSVQQQDIHLQMRDFRLAGVALAADDKQQYASLKQQLAQLSTQFSNNVMDTTDQWSMHFNDSKRLLGLPESSLLQARQLAASKEQTGYLLNLDFACYQAVVTFADDRDLRRTIYKAFNTRASDQGPHDKQYDNTQIMTQLVTLRQQLAQLVGYDNYAEYSVASKMADSGVQAHEFLQDLARQCKPLAVQEMAQLQDFVSQQDGPQPLQAWDIAYYSEKLRQARFDLSQEELKPYFALPQVQAGLFAIVERLFGIQVEQVDGVPVWHEDVSFYRISQHGKALGYFYFDLFARQQKRGGAWMNDCRTRQQLVGQQTQLPVAYLVCNFAPASDNQPALLTHNDVVTLFHEFGHGLHHMLTQIDVAGVAGINGVAWDAVELPSQLLENWAWQKASLMMFAKHYQTGEPLPAAMLQKMLAAKHFQSAMFMLRQLEFGLFDLRLHSQSQSERFNVQAVLDQVRQEVAVITAPDWNRFQHGFSHIFAGGYAAGYYSYMWADVLAADVFERFLAEGIFNPQTGQQYWHQLLGRGGSADAMQLFIDFMGRKPDVAALIRSKGLGEAA